MNCAHSRGQLKAAGLLLVAGLWLCLQTIARAAPSLQITHLSLEPLATTSTSTSTERYLLHNASGGATAEPLQYAALKILDSANHTRRLFIKASLEEPSSTSSPTAAPEPKPTQPTTATCTLGNDTFQVGDRWNPVLPPFGVQVCVQCECIVRQRSFCFEPKVTCRRTYDDCPLLEACAGGRKPVTVANQCCKVCPEERHRQLSATSSNPSTPPSVATKRAASHERQVREYQSIMRTMPQCAPKDRPATRENRLHSVGPSSTPAPPTTLPATTTTTTPPPPPVACTTSTGGSTGNETRRQGTTTEQQLLLGEPEERALSQMMAKKNRSEIIHFTLILID